MKSFDIHLSFLNIKILKKRLFKKIKYKKKKTITSLNHSFLNNYQKKNISIQVKFCVFAGRQKNMNILHKYIKELLKLKIIHEYHIFDFSRHLSDKHFLLESYKDFNKEFKNQIFIHNHKKNTSFNNQHQYDWSPFYKTISKKKFNKNSVIIKCDDDILFIDIHGLKNAIQERIQDKTSFILHSNCINNNICTYFHKMKFENIQEKLNHYPKGGILGPCFENPFLAAHMHNQFTNDLINDISSLNKYFINNIYLNHRISINFILLNGIDCKYFKHISFNDEYELSSYYPEKLLRPNKIIGNFITSHFSYSLQDKLLNKNKSLHFLYSKLSNIYLEKYNLNIDKNKLNMNVNNQLFKINNWGKNKFYIKNWLNENHYYLKCNDQYLYIDYFDDLFSLTKNKRSLFEIHFIEDNIIEIQLGIYKFNKYNLSDVFKNRHLLLKFLYNTQESKIKIEKINNMTYLKFLKSNLYISWLNQSFQMTQTPVTSWNLIKPTKLFESIYIKRYIKNKKIFYKSLNHGDVFTNFYLGWGYENIIVL